VNGAAARALAAAPFTGAAISTFAATPARVRRLIEATGSQIDAEGLGFYLRLVRDPDHIEGTIGMMSRWSVSEVNAALETLAAPVLMIAGTRDLAVPPGIAAQVAARIPRGRSLEIEGFGHLLHEENAPAVLGAIEEWA
jgi:magnesium chelatase accessory protein